LQQNDGRRWKGSPCSKPLLKQTTRITRSKQSWRWDHSCCCCSLGYSWRLRA